MGLTLEDALALIEQLREDIERGKHNQAAELEKLKITISDLKFKLARKEGQVDSLEDTIQKFIDK